ncbi:hypothetical protein Mmar10_2842 [Maricaulis maris MCS10]|uniref:Uncharacterized protein n=2 Tax=Maricaulis maris TaxID=74318 RepID=Q0AKS0_MARMM|nr:hypothetical protein Mmar10_2842 [Maricaulis maris MCS10]
MKFHPDGQQGYRKIDGVARGLRRRSQTLTPCSRMEHAMTMTDVLPAGEVRRLPVKRARVQDDLVADFLATTVKPGQRTIQIGAGDLGAVCLKRGAHHQIVATMGAIEALQAACDRRAIPTDALSGGPAARIVQGAPAFDLAIFGSETGFPAMAGNWRHVSGHLREGGVLVLLGADHGACARLADALDQDPSWQLEARIGGEAAVFRKTGQVSDATALAGLAKVGDPSRRPRGIRNGLVRRLFERLLPGRQQVG